MPIFTNVDGLTLRYGVDKGKVEPIGEFEVGGPVRVVEINVNPTLTPTVAQNSIVISDKYILPKGAVIERVEFQGGTDFTGTSTVNIGLVDASDGTSNASVNALVDAITVAEMNAGGTNIAGWIGTGINTKLTTAKYLTWEADTAAVAGGIGYFRIYYSVERQEIL